MIELNEREKNILKCVVQNFILTANPVGSRIISKKYDIKLSPATIRNVMADLEEMGLIFHPHTSAGRIPTDQGYRFYVDSLMEVSELTSYEKKSIEKELTSEVEDREELLQITSRILSKISSQLSLVSYPRIINSTLEKLQLVTLPHKVLMVILSLRSGFIKTISLELPVEIDSQKLDAVQSILNERICGLSLLEIKNSFTERFKDLKNEKTGVVRLFLSSLNKIFQEPMEVDKVHISGVTNILKSPEFKELENIQGVVELLEDKEMILHVLDKAKEIPEEEVLVSIGAENKLSKLQDYSLITAYYKSGDTDGILGVIGPRRMNYSKMIAVVSYISKLLTEVLTNKN